MQRCLQEAKEIKAKLEAEETIVEFVEKSWSRTDELLGQLLTRKIAEELQKQFGIKIDKTSYPSTSSDSSSWFDRCASENLSRYHKCNQSSCERRISLHLLDKIVKGREV